MANETKTSRRVVNGTWYEVCVQVNGEIRDVIEEFNMHAARSRSDQLAAQWPNCELVFARQHRAEPERGVGCSKFVVLQKLTLDFRAEAVR